MFPILFISMGKTHILYWVSAKNIDDFKFQSIFKRKSLAYLKNGYFANYWHNLLQDQGFSSKAEICQFSTSDLGSSHVKLVTTIDLVECRYVPPEQAKVVASVHASISGSSASSTSSTPEVKPLKSLLGEAAPALHLNKGTPSQVSHGCWGAQNSSAVLFTLSVAQKFLQ